MDLYSQAECVSLFFPYNFVFLPRKSAIMKNTRKMTNNSFAMVAAIPAKAKNPKAAARIATSRKIIE
jgi:hypothetical protein